MARQFEDSKKIITWLLEQVKGKRTPLLISVNDIQEAVGTNLNKQTVWAIVKNHSILSKKVTMPKSGEPGSKLATYDKLYNENRSARELWKEKNPKLDWSNAEPWQKRNFAKNTFPNRQKFLKTIPKNYIPSGEFVKKTGLNLTTLYTMQTKGTEVFPMYKFITDKFKPIESGNFTYYKDPSVTELRGLNLFKEREVMTKKMRDYVTKLHKELGPTIKQTKKLPTLEVVQDTLGIKSPTTAANAVRSLARAYKGDVFRRLEGIDRDVVTGKRLIKQIGEVGRYNPYRQAFYNLALKEIDALYGAQHGKLTSFKNVFRKTLNGLVKNNKYNLNEVIGLSVGESRGAQPFSVFVDVVDSKINQVPLAQYQGRLSKNIEQVNKLITQGKLDEAALKAGDLRGALSKTKATLAGPKYNLTAEQIRQLRFPEVVVGETVSPEIYKPENLAKWKKQGLDIEKFAKEKGWYIDTKGSRPYWEVGANRLKQVAETLKNKDKVRICSFLSNGGLPGNCARAIEKNPIKSAEIFSKLPDTTGAVGKLKNASTRFLSLLGRGGARAAPLAALAAAGAAIEPLVKQFRIDDPTTYLTDESQMKGMLLATIEGETPKVDEELLNWQYPGMAAATVAGAVPGAGEVYKARRSGVPLDRSIGPVKGVGKTRAALGLSGVLGKALGASFSPLAVAATLPISVAAQRAGGTDYGDIATDPFNWMGPAFASTGAEMASKGIQNPMLLKALRMGMSPRTLSLVSRRFGLPGLAVSAGMWGYDKWKNRGVNDPED